MSLVEPHSAIAQFNGQGQACCHHGEILQGVFEEEVGTYTPGVVSLLMNMPGAAACFSGEYGDSGITVSPAEKTKALNAALETLKWFGRADISGHLNIDTYVEEELGFGSSTADVVAACYAIAEALGETLNAETVAKIAVASEWASDPIMFSGDPLLFAQREGRVIEVLGNRLPSMSVLSFRLGAAVSTCVHDIPDYSQEERRAFSSLLQRLKNSIEAADLNTLAEVALSSAQINQRYRPKPYFYEVVSIAEKCGFPGLQIAHSGNLVGLIADPSDNDLPMRTAEAEQRLQSIGVRKVSSFF